MDMANMKDPRLLLAAARPLARRFIVSNRLLIVVVILVLITVNHLSDNAIGDAVWRPPALPDDPPGAWDQHPVVLLHQQAEIEHQAFLNRDPPPGFRRWVEYALANGSPVIDDFDMIAEGVHPFLQHTAAEIKGRIEAVMRDKLADQVSMCKFESGKFTSGCRMWGTPMNGLLGSAGELLPDVELLINFLDEPSLLPTEEAVSHNGSAETPWADLGRQSIAAAVKESCKAQGPPGKLTPQPNSPVDTSMFAVHFTNMINCDAQPSACDEQRSFFGLAPARHPGSRALRYQLALDLDGNSFSMRFYRFLASRTCPLKVTVFREWHDERLRPWLHYIPISVGMDELPEVVRFLTRTKAGQRVAHRVAEAGREWYDKAVKPTHQGIYLYRLMLEMARVMYEGRKAG
ncbi:hypothetical protein MAPG_08785 [Magnaporthiopsis poae ATCC 64411]|uniref:Glycosyl transferase CAP10 domain-containing protein n=1 Tax=Magnaporthiopsis poae (strain ATCC 64411 / 73-15) TaxID=644358 RepID=A0A0C4E888_MAGP6|nr:hypothetical protein MAPG_08785 [Magnaporthiopsis poae ATCC 64411]